MNVLLITSDLNVLRDRSAARVAMGKYATLTKHMVVIVLNTNRNRYPVDKISDSLLIIPTNSYFGILAPLTALRLVRREIFFQGCLLYTSDAADDLLCVD